MRVALTFSKSKRDCFLVISIVASCVRDNPSASPSTLNNEIPLSVQAATIIREAAFPSRTYIFVPLSSQASLEAVASIVMPSLPHFPLSSVKAKVAIVSPLAIPGRSSAFAASSPE